MTDEVITERHKKAVALRQIRAVLERPENWTKGVMGRDKEGRDAPVSEANSFCLLGAAISVVSIGDIWTMELLKDVILPKTSRTALCVVSKWNDDERRRHSEVLAMLDAGISRYDKQYVSPRKSLWARFQSWRSKGV